MSSITVTATPQAHPDLYVLSSGSSSPEFLVLTLFEISLNLGDVTPPLGKRNTFDKPAYHTHTNARAGESRSAECGGGRGAERQDSHLLNLGGASLSSLGHDKVGENSPASEIPRWSDIERDRRDPKCERALTGFQGRRTTIRP